MIKALKHYYKKYKEITNYIVFGILTTVVNYVCYLFITRVLYISVVVSTIIAWVLAVLFAYVTNKKFVFKSNSFNIYRIIKEMASFFSLRIVSGVFEIMCMYVFVAVMNFNDILIKLIVNVVVIILNYIFSKCLVFKNKNNA